MDSFKSTLMHVLELVAVLAVTYGVQRFFQVGNEAILAVVLVVLSGLAKLARAHDAVPLGDYVNEK